MIYHVLNGDGLAGGFNLEGEKVTCREALIEGDLRAKNLAELWNVRAEFFNDDSYFEKVKGEFDKLNELTADDEVNLWFGNEAFCQVNLWFILWLFGNKKATFYRVFPDGEDWDCSFNDLQKCLQSRKRLTENDLLLGSDLWMVICSQDFEPLKTLSKMSSDKFPHLGQVCQALLEKDTKPKETLREITKDGETDFNKIFPQFKAKAGIYGFGDLQVKNLLNEV